MACGLPLRGPLGEQLWRVSVQASELLRQREHLLLQLRAARDPSAGPPPGDAPAGASASPAASAADISGVRRVLVALGVLVGRIPPALGGGLGSAEGGQVVEALVLVAVTFVAGAGIEVFSMGWNLAMQENIDDQMLSRAYSYDALGSFVAMPIGQLAYGPLGAAFGYRDVLVWSGVAYVVIALLALTSRSVRTLDRRSEPAATVVPTS